MKKAKAAKKKASPAPKKKKTADPKKVDIKTIGSGSGTKMPLALFLLVSAVMISAFALIMMAPMLQSQTSGAWNSDASRLMNAKNQVTSFVLSVPKMAMTTVSMLENRLGEQFHIRLPFQTRSALQTQPSGTTGVYEAPSASQTPPAGPAN